MLWATSDSKNAKGTILSFKPWAGAGTAHKTLKMAPFIINRRNAQKHATFANFGRPSDTVQKFKSWPLDLVRADPTPSAKSAIGGSAGP